MMSGDFFATSILHSTSSSSSFSSHSLFLNTKFGLLWPSSYFVFLLYCWAVMWIPCANGITNLADVECGNNPHASSVGNGGDAASLSSAFSTPLSLLLLRRRHQDDHYRTVVFQEHYYSSSDTNTVPILYSGNTRKARIINGENAIHGEAPWIVSIKFRRSNNHFCGGTIVNKRYILSAAHCFHGILRGGFSVNMIKVTVGEYNQSGEEWPVDALDVGIESIIFHQDFKLRGYVNDIALLRLERDLKWGPTVWPACIVDQSDDDVYGREEEKEETERMKATVYGWGQAVDSHDGSNYFPEVLQKVSVPILSNTECAKWFHRQDFKWSPGDGHLCAGYEILGKDSCQGDSGGPLLLQPGESKQAALVGIVAAGHGCGQPGFPGIYTRVSTYRDWIISHIINC